MTSVSNRWPFFVIVSFLVLVCGGFSSGLWSMMLASQPPPAMWLIILTYLLVYKKFPQNILFSYFLVFLVHQFTVTPMKVLLLSTMLLFVTLTFLRSKIFWFGSTYFLGAVAYSLFLFKLSYLFCSKYLENSLAPVMIVDFILEMGWTLLATVPLYRVMKWLDDKFDSEPRGEFGL